MMEAGWGEGLEMEHMIYFWPLRRKIVILHVICSNLSGKYTGLIVQITWEPLSTFVTDEMEEDHLLAHAGFPVS